MDPSNEHSTPINELFLTDEELEHFGVKGMHWGVRKEEALSDVPKKTSHEAEKDAQEYARAKMFYGSGAGNRRKLIKATVEAKSAKDPAYKKAFEHHLENQDMSVHAQKARAERKRKNAASSTAKTARGVRHVVNGNAQYASLAAAMLAGGAMAAHKHGIDKVVVNAGKNAYKKATDPTGRKWGENLLKDLGV
jgi:hypothetical protein